MRFLSFLFVFSFIFLQCKAQENSSSADTTAYPWLKPSLNYVQYYHRDALAYLYYKWKLAPKQKFSVVFFGDSHLQQGSYPDAFRKRLQEALGNGGKGLLTAFSAANTYSNTDYKTTHKGEWIYAKSFMKAPKLPLGVSGMSVRTGKLPAVLSFSFKEKLTTENNLLTIFCKKSSASFDIKLVIDETHTIIVSTDSTDNLPFIRLHIPPVRQSIRLEMQKSRENQSFFEFYGMILENADDKFAILHNAGVGAAKYGSMLRKDLLAEQLPYFKPDLIVLDFGTNDYLYDDKIAPDLENQIREIIAKIRKITPDAVILLTTAQDLYWRKVNVKSGRAFSELIHKIASETKCLVYDWYWVAGGQTVMRDWFKAGLTLPDMVHLNAKGYTLKGNLFFEAFINTFQYFEKNPTQRQFILDTDSLKRQQAHFQGKRILAYDYHTPTATKKNKPKDTASQAKIIVPVKTQPHPKKITYIVKQGDTLFGIAQKYKVSVLQLQTWNNLKDNNLRIGQELIIELQK
ncbi:MAG: GDSL-type esterase/lipase family protein [Raineya sp.]|nr:GDSL-type esterase/lipase family protein [Raineya sp.]